MRETTHHRGDETLLPALGALLGVLGLRLSRWRRFGGERVRFRKYRVAPRLGTNTVRRRLLHGLHAHRALAATKAGTA
jgi:hypothetical protein